MPEKLTCDGNGASTGCPGEDVTVAVAPTPFVAVPDDGVLEEPEAEVEVVDIFCRKVSEIATC